MKELTKQENKIVIPSEFLGFTEEEVNAGMNPVQYSYLKNFKYMMTRPSVKPKLTITNNQTDEIVWEGNKLTNAIIYYGHEVMRLKKGHVENPMKNESEYTDEENELLAITYDPQNSRGNFDLNGYGEYLSKEYKHLHSKMKRLYLFLMLPEKSYKTGLDIVAASFSITTLKSFNELRKQLRFYMLPLPIIKTEIFFSDAVSESGQEYDRIDFSIMKDQNGSIKFSHKSRESYLTSDFGKKLLDQIIETHRAAIEIAEKTSSLSYNSDSDVIVPPKTRTQKNEEVTAEFIKNKFSGEEVDAEAFNEIPF